MRQFSVARARQDAGLNQITERSGAVVQQALALLGGEKHFPGFAYAFEFLDLGPGILRSDKADTPCVVGQRLEGGKVAACAVFSGPATSRETT